MKNIIITVGYGYNAKELQPFIESANQYMPDTDIILFSNNQTNGFLKEIKQFNPNVKIIQPVDFSIREKLWQLKRGISPFGVALDYIQMPLIRYSIVNPLNKLNIALLHVAISRYIWIQFLLESSGSDIGLILLSDSRDVIFQGDPFDSYPGKLICGEEPITIGEERYNANWFKRVYPEPVFRQISQKPVLCSGVTLGSYQQISAYINAMVLEIIDTKIRLNARLGLDQSIHNKILYLDKVLPYTVSKNGDSLLATLARSNLDEFNFDPEQGLKTMSGEMVKIVHQYNRHPILADWVDKKY